MLGANAQPSWQRSALASCGDAVLEKTEAPGILDHSVRSRSAVAASQGAQGAVVAERRRRQGDDDPGRLDRRSLGMEGMRWAGTHDGGRLQRDVDQFRYNTRQAQHPGQDCAGRGQFQGKLRGLLSAHTSGCAEGADALGSETSAHCC